MKEDDSPRTIACPHKVRNLYGCLVQNYTQLVIPHPINSYVSITITSVAFFRDILYFCIYEYKVAVLHKM